MPAPKANQKTETYQNIRGEANARGAWNDCAVIAISIATGVDYATVSEMVAERGRKEGQGTHTMIIKGVLRALGYETIVRYADEFIAKYPKPHCNALKSVTSHHPDRFPKAWNDGNTYMMIVSGGAHILTIKDGVNHDWTRGKAKRAAEIWQIVKAGENTTADRKAEEGGLKEVPVPQPSNKRMKTIEDYFTEDQIRVYGASRLNKFLSRVKNDIGRVIGYTMAVQGRGTKAGSRTTIEGKITNVEIASFRQRAKSMVAQYEATIQTSTGHEHKVIVEKFRGLR